VVRRPVDRALPNGAGARPSVTAADDAFTLPGHSWVTVDRRADEAFRWRLQTRAFTVAEPGEYTHYRRTVTENSGEPTLTIAEIQLLAQRS
jgi:hypothetical protein